MEIQAMYTALLGAEGINVATFTVITKGSGDSGPQGVCRTSVQNVSAREMKIRSIHCVPKES